MSTPPPPPPYNTSLYSHAPIRVPNLASSVYSHSASIATPDSVAGAAWYPDSGASSHVTLEFQNLMHSSPCHGADQLRVGNGQGLNISHIGHSNIILPHSSSRSLRLQDLLYVLSITKNLVSVSKLARDNCVFFEFHLFHCFVKSQDTNEVLLHSVLGKDGLYRFNSFQLQHLPSPHTPGSASSRTCSPSLHLSIFCFT